MADSLTVLGPVRDYVRVETPGQDSLTVVDFTEYMLVVGHLIPVIAGNHYLTEASDRFATEGADLFILE